MATTLSPSELVTWVKTHIERFGQSAFRITVPGKVIYIDIFEPIENPVPADLLLVTHEHPDHFHKDVVKSVLKPGTDAVFAASTKAAGQDQGFATETLAPGETKTVGTIAITAVPAYNLTAKFHPRDKQWVGYLFEVDGVIIYHAGDTDLIPEMKAIKADVVMLPVGGLFTMDVATAVEAATTLNAPVVIPMHYGKVPLTGGAGKSFAKAWTGVSVVMETE